jgi:hypothetical protein
MADTELNAGFLGTRARNLGRWRVNATNQKRRQSRFLNSLGALEEGVLTTEFATR